MCITLSQTMYKDVYSNLFLRLSCYSCSSKAGRSNSDITIGDFWGIDNLNPIFNDHKGINAILIFSSAGEKIFELLSVDKKEMTFNEVLSSNSALSSSVPLSHNRNRFWKNYSNSKDLKYCILNPFNQF